MAGRSGSGRARGLPCGGVPAGRSIGLEYAGPLRLLGRELRQRHGQHADLIGLQEHPAAGGIELDEARRKLRRGQAESFLRQARVRVTPRPRAWHQPTTGSSPSCRCRSPLRAAGTGTRWPLAPAPRSPSRRCASRLAGTPSNPSQCPSAPGSARSCPRPSCRSAPRSRPPGSPVADLGDARRKLHDGLDPASRQWRGEQPGDL